MREAIKMLTAKGLVRSWPRRGTVVEDESRWNLMDPDVLTWLLERRISPTLLEEFLHMRLAIEPAAASMAASKGADTGELALALQAMRDASDAWGMRSKPIATFTRQCCVRAATGSFPRWHRWLGPR